MPAQILSPAPENIAFLGERLRAGALVAMPTETVYGLAANLWNESALTEVFAVKERPKFDPLICHIWPPNNQNRPLGWIERLVGLGLVDSPTLGESRYASVQELAENFWPGPLTLVLPKAARVPDLATSGLDTLAIRVPRHPAALALLEAAKVPLCAPSANRFGRISPTTAQDVFDELGDRIEFILDGGPCEIGLESTVLAFEDSGPRILRRGGVSQEELSSFLDRRVEYAPLSELGSGQLSSPGMLASHYAPRKKLHLLRSPLSEITSTEFSEVLALLPSGAQVGLLAQRGTEDSVRRSWDQLTKTASISPALAVAASLSVSGSDYEAANRLFRTLRALDASPQTTHLIAERPAKAEGLAAAILDRLERAAH
jgi:L-threonylcarbamoyladenylate synthase